MHLLTSISELSNLPTCTQKLLLSLKHTTNVQMLLCYETGELGLLSLELPNHLRDTAYVNIFDGVMKDTNISETWIGFTVDSFVYLSLLKLPLLNHLELYHFSQELLMEYITHMQNTIGEQCALTRARRSLLRFGMLDIE